MKKGIAILTVFASILLLLAGCSQPEATPTTGEATTEATVAPTEEPFDPTEGIDVENIYYVGPDREHKSITQLFIDLKDDVSEKVIFLDAGTYDIYQEYRDAGIETPPDDIASANYFYPYNAFLPMNTRLVGVGEVTLDFSPEADEITYGESRTWSPLNITGPCYIENITIFCKNGRYAIHDDSHNAEADRGGKHTYKNVHVIYETADTNSAGQRLGFNNTIGDGIASGAEFLFEDCSFEFRGGTAPAFYIHDSSVPDHSYPAPTLTFRDCTFDGGSAANNQTIRLQSLSEKDTSCVVTKLENCHIKGGIYLEIYKERCSFQHFDVTLENSGTPQLTIDQEDRNPYPVKNNEK